MLYYIDHLILWDLVKMENEIEGIFFKIITLKLHSAKCLKCY